MGARFSGTKGQRDGPDRRRPRSVNRRRREHQRTDKGSQRHSSTCPGRLTLILQWTSTALRPEQLLNHPRRYKFITQQARLWRSEKRGPPFLELFWAPAHLRQSRRKPRLLSPPHLLPFSPPPPPRRSPPCLLASATATAVMHSSAST